MIYITQANQKIISFQTKVKKKTISDLLTLLVFIEPII